MFSNTDCTKVELKTIIGSWTPKLDDASMTARRAERTSGRRFDRSILNRVEYVELTDKYR
eukprot:SAG25_NODE_13187_length_270_cov_0.719298_1_plen_59_part_10